MTTIFIGLVSHRQTSRPWSQGPQGLAQLLRKELRALGYTVPIQINTQDFLTTSGIHVTNHLVAASPAAELRIERRWARYLGIDNSLSWRTTHLLRWLRYWTFASWRRNTRPVERLLNIELSHRDLLDRSIGADAEWTLILEDDAQCSNIPDLAHGLQGIIDRGNSPCMVNLSHSFSAQELRVDHLLYLHEAHPWLGSEARLILATRKPISNTVCAVLYRRDFLQALTTEFSTLPVVPVAPIDWKLNQALMNLFDHRQVGDGDCWWVQPAPITQESMHRTESSYLFSA